MNTRYMSLCSALALLAAACGGGTETTGEDGGNGGATTTTTGSGNTGSGSATTTTDTTTTTGSGGGEPCHPTVENGWCEAEDSCECKPTDTTEDSWCDAYEGVGIFICPDGASYCTPGQNRCGYDLPPDTDYEAADPTCKEFVDGDVWAGNDVQSDFNSHLNENGQLHLSFGSMFGDEAEYYTGFTMSGKKFYWNLANKEGYHWGEGEIHDGCTSLEVRFYLGGETIPYKTRMATHVHQ